MAHALADLICALPKAELHVHLEGSTPARLAGAWAQREGAKIPGLSQDAQGSWAYTFSGFSRFIECYLALSHCITKQQDIVDLAQAVAQDLAEQQIRYAEVTFTPTTHLARNWEPAPLIEALRAAQARARDLGVTFAWVFDFVRSYPDTAEATVDFALRAQDAGASVVGFGVGGPEGDEWPGTLFAKAFERAKRQGLASLPHAGENRGAQGVREAIEMLGADRIGHGIRAVEDPAILELLEASGICLEICPTSNLHLLGIESLAVHPLSTIQQRRIAWTLASDDPPLVGTTLNQEYLRCADAYGWDAQMIRQVAERSFEHACLAPERRSEYLDQVSQAFAQWSAAPK